MGWQFQLKTFKKKFAFRALIVQRCETSQTFKGESRLVRGFPHTCTWRIGLGVDVV